MEFYTETIPFGPGGIKSRLDRLRGIYKQINNIPEEADPALLARKVTLLNTAQGIIGELYAQSVYDSKNAYNERKEAQATYELNYKGTAKEKEAYSRMKVAELLKKEAEAEAELKRWEKAYNSHEMLANAIKYEVQIVFDDYKAGGRA